MKEGTALSSTGLLRLQSTRGRIETPEAVPHVKHATTYAEEYRDRPWPGERFAGRRRARTVTKQFAARAFEFRGAGAGDLRGRGAALRAPAADAHRPGWFGQDPTGPGRGSRGDAELRGRDMAGG